MSVCVYITLTVLIIQFYYITLGHVKLLDLYIFQQWLKDQCIRLLNNS